MRTRCCYLLILTTLIISAGCATTPKDKDVYSEKVISSFFSNPADPRRYGLTVYKSKYGPVFSDSKRLHPWHVAQTDFIKSSPYLPYPLINVRGRKPQLFPALLDTSSRDSWGNLTAGSLMLANPLGPPPYRRFADHVNDPSPGYATYASKLIIDKLHVENMIFYTRIPNITLGRVGRSVKKPAPNLVLGCDLLSKFSFVRFDFPQKKVTISSSKKFNIDPDRILTQTSYQKKYGVFTIEALIDNQLTPMVIDTAGDYEIAWNKTDSIEQLFIGDFLLSDIQVTPAQADTVGYPETPRIGLRLLKRFVLTIDNARHQIYLERSVRQPGKLIKPDKTEPDKNIYDTIVLP